MSENNIRLNILYNKYFCVCSLNVFLLSYRIFPMKDQKNIFHP